MPNFRSLGQSLHIDNFCKNDGGGGEGGWLKSLRQKKPHAVCWYSVVFQKDNNSGICKQTFGIPTKRKYGNLGNLAGSSCKG